MKVWAGIVLIVSTAATSAVWMRRDPAESKKNDAATLFEVRRGDLRVTVTENGTLKAQNAEKITPLLRREGKITMVIEEGKQVKNGEVICRLDATALENEKQQLELDIVKTTADLATAETELEIQKTENIANVERAELELLKADKDLEKYEEGDARQQLRKLTAAVREAELKSRRANKQLEDSRELEARGFLTPTQLEQEQIEAEQAASELASARGDLELFEKYTREMTLLEKRASARDRTRGLDTAKKRAKSQLKQKEVAVEGNRRRLASLNKKLEEVNEEIGHCAIASPLEGIVLYGDPEQPWYRDNIKLGGQIWGGMTLFTIPDLSVMQVQTHVHEADIDKIKKDQPATVTMDTYPGLVLEGRVTRIASVAGEGRWRTSDEVKRFAVDVTLEPTGERKLKPGISAKAEIFVAGVEDCLHVPIQCVFVEEGGHYAYVYRDGQAVRQAVTPGVSNESYIEIVDGLEEGQRVLMYNPALTGPAGGEALAADEDPESDEKPVSESALPQSTSH